MKMSGLAAAVLVAAFVIPQNPTEQGPAIALARAEALWQARGPKSYRFGIMLTCECFPKGMNFRVVGGRAQLPPGADAASQRFHESFGTIERLFAQIRRVITNGGYRVAVKYDAELGYPIWGDLDPRREVIDDELFFRVSGFNKLALRSSSGQIFPVRSSNQKDARPQEMTCESPRSLQCRLRFQRRFPHR